MSSIFSSLFEDFLRHKSGGLGFALRKWYYSKRLRSCGKNVRIDTGVYFTNPGGISIGSDVWIDKDCHLIAGWRDVEEAKIKRVSKGAQNAQQGIISIGNHVHIGIGTIIQGHGGVHIGDCFTASAGCRIYSFSNDPFKCKAGTHNSESADIYYVVSPVHIGNNVWLGINATVIGNTIHDDCFIHPNAVVVSDIEAGSIAAGFPAQRIKPRFKAQDHQ